MGRPRIELQGLLETVTGLPHDSVYFQPPPTMSVNTPCAIYQIDTLDTKYADNAPYRIETRYMVTIIDRNPDSALISKVASLPKCTFSRFYTANNLNHYVFTLYF